MVMDHDIFNSLSILLADTNHGNIQSIVKIIPTRYTAISVLGADIFKTQNDPDTPIHLSLLAQFPILDIRDGNFDEAYVAFGPFTGHDVGIAPNLRALNYGSGGGEMGVLYGEMYVVGGDDLGADDVNDVVPTTVVSSGVTFILSFNLILVNCTIIFATRMTTTDFNEEQLGRTEIIALRLTGDDTSLPRLLRDETEGGMVAVVDVGRA
mmetsp:Transcript_18651/g.39033  ORF Transcript_18651/g.39033 Transcript_18651/m.39033 type:complete len:209 (-) Transcript_18651:791-1417(-)